MFQNDKNTHIITSKWEFKLYYSIKCHSEKKKLNFTNKFSIKKRFEGLKYLKAD